MSSLSDNSASYFLVFLGGMLMGLDLPYFGIFWFHSLIFSEVDICWCLRLFCSATTAVLIGNINLYFVLCEVSKVF